MKNTKKYILYAFGEVVLVVIGILIALYINNQSEEYKVKQSEIVLLKKLKEENLYNLSTISDNLDYHEKLPDIYINFIYHLLDNKVTEMTDSLSYYLNETMRSTTYTFSNTNLQNFIKSQKNNFPETNKEIIYLDNLQSDLYLVSYKCVELKIDNYFQYINNDFDFTTGEVYSTKTINSVGFRNNLNLIHSLEQEVSLKYKETYDQMLKVDSLISKVLRE